ncbi:MAG TPA: RNA polymerase sigma factor [Fulvivirga sp.]|nr:RNA polymerase sigma factor [Fulvivirga sp.]
MNYKTDKSLFNSLYQQYHAMVLQMCLGFVKGDHDLAKDLSQDVFINTWNALSKFRGASSYKTWIYRITVNTCLKYIGAKQNQKKLSIEEVNIPQEPESDDQEQHDKLYRAIGQLDKIDRLIIMMVLEETDYDEIAEVMGISATNLRVKIHRARKTLKKILENER